MLHIAANPQLFNISACACSAAEIVQSLSELLGAGPFKETEPSCSAGFESPTAERAINFIAVLIAVCGSN